VNESTLQSVVVGDRVVRIDGAAKLDITKDRVLERLSGDVRYNRGTDLAEIPVKDAMHDGLVLVWASAFGLNAATLVHVLCLTANEGFVRFQLVAFATDLCCLAELLTLHYLADALQHKPCRGLRDLDRARQFVATDSVLAVRQHPEGDHPLVEADRGIFHNRLDLDRKLLLAGIAEPYATSLDERVLRCRTARTRNLTVRPSQLNRVGEAAFRIRKVYNRFLQRRWLWNLDRRFHNHDYTLRAHVCQLV